MIVLNIYPLIKGHKRLYGPISATYKQHKYVKDTIHVYWFAYHLPLDSNWRRSGFNKDLFMRKATSKI